MTEPEHLCIACAPLNPRRCPRSGCGKRMGIDASDDEWSWLCPACGRRDPARIRHVESGLACPPCQAALGRLPGEIADAYPLLFGLELPGAQGGDGRSKNPEAPLPFVVDPLDLVSPWATPQGPLRQARLAANADLQQGHMPVRDTLWWRIKDVLTYRHVGESGPDPDVPAMCSWLEVRTEWLCESYLPLDEYADEMVQLRGLLFALVGRPTVDERPKSFPVPCPRCRRMTLLRRADDHIECEWEDCRRVYSPEDWATVSKATAQAIRRGQISREDASA